MIDVDLKALLSHLNPYCLRALESAAGMCMSRGNYEVAPSHLMYKLMDDANADVQIILRHYEIEPARLGKVLQAVIEEARTGNSGKPVFSPQLIEWVQAAWMVGSIEHRLSKIRSGVLLVSMLSTLSRFSHEAYVDLLRAIPVDELRRQFNDITAGSTEEPELPDAEVLGLGPEMGSSDTALGRFTINFTARARNGEIDPVFSRDREIRQMVDILARRRKNNPIAVGEAGVGKTAVVEGLALKIVEGDVPDILSDVELLGLDLGLLQAGASVKGEFENRLKSVIDEVKASPKPIILFIDEAHTLIGAGGQAGQNDAANLLKPALARGELRTVAATTWSEYKKYFEKDPALARRFQLVKLDEPSPDDAVTILRGLRDSYEAAHGVYVRDDAVDAAARYSARYISGRQLPDKAVDVLDTACARVRISLSAKPPLIDDKERRIQMLERELAAVERDLETGVTSDVEAAQELRTLISTERTTLKELQSRWEKEKEAVAQVVGLRRQLAQAKESGEGDTAALHAALDAAKTALAAVQGDEPLIHYEVGPEVVGAVIADWTGIPLGKMVRDEADSILRFGEVLKERIKGQDHAIDAIHQGLRAAKAGLNNPNTPMGVFLFVGPSGVGKTETATGVADLLFGGERFMVTINMSEFQEKHTLSRLVGSPPGYVGYGEGGVLTEGVRQRPYSVVLLDEVEKADLEVMNLFYQVFDKGTLSDGEGRNIDFKNTVVFLTSNLASDIITEMAGGDNKPDPAELIAAIRPVLARHFKPALLARMEIVPFYPIVGEALHDIVGLKLERLGQRLRVAQKMDFSYAPEVVTQIAKRCTEVESGARNVDHIINRTLLPRIATEVLHRMQDEAMPTALHLDIGKSGDFSFEFKTAGAGV
ncbi:MAG TPA: type VI secretion system ATPase TssH [Gammaproteobacteria bacterium]|nr:type VI secretion system ATPase TssH [Gammaproteobacteria bacterium]